MSVGTETWPRRTSGLPAMRFSFGVVVSASGGWLGASPGATPGQRLIVVCDGDGGHPEGGVCAVAAKAQDAATAKMAMDFMLGVLVESQR